MLRLLLPSGGLTERRITTLCRDGRIEGAKKENGVWLVPENAEKPKDGRSNKFSKAAGTITKLPLPIGVSDFKDLVENRKKTPTLCDRVSVLLYMKAACAADNYLFVSLPASL